MFTCSHSFLWGSWCGEICRHAAQAGRQSDLRGRHLGYIGSSTAPLRPYIFPSVTVLHFVLINKISCVCIHYRFLLQSGKGTWTLSMLVCTRVRCWCLICVNWRRVVVVPCMYQKIFGSPCVTLHVHVFPLRTTRCHCAFAYLSAIPQYSACIEPTHVYVHVLVRFGFVYILVFVIIMFLTLQILSQIICWQLLIRQQLRTDCTCSLILILQWVI